MTTTLRPTASAIDQQITMLAAIGDAQVYADLQTPDEQRAEVVAADFLCRAYLEGLKLGNQNSSDIAAQVLEEMREAEAGST